MFSFFGIKERERERNYRPELRSLIICNVQPNRVNSGFSGINGNLRITYKKNESSPFISLPIPQTALSLLLLH